MADTKISELASATALNDSDYLAGVNAGTTKKFTLGRIKEHFKVVFDGAYAAITHDHSRLFNGTYALTMPTDLKKSAVLAVKTDLNAEGISYDHTDSGLQAENVQAAVDELKTGQKDNDAAIKNLGEGIKKSNDHIADKENPHGVTADQIKAIPTSQRGTKNGVAALDANATVPPSQLPTFVSAVSLTVENMTLRIRVTASK